MAGAEHRIPVLVLTGFLGAGKTSVLRHVLGHADFSDTAVIINEAGDVGLDHLFVENSEDEVVMLDGGCLCCRMKGGLADALNALLRRRDASGALPFSRVIVETSGLANPVPILASVMTSKLAAAHFVLAGVTTVVNGVAFAESWERFAEVRAQVALADRLLLTRGDMLTPDALAALHARLQALNPAATLTGATHGVVEPQALWPDPEDRLVGGGRRGARMLADGGGAEAQFVVAARTFSGELDPDDLDDWLWRWINLLGPDLLRVKGVLRVSCAAEPVILHVVQGIVHAPQAARTAPADDGARIALIAAGVEQASLDDALDELAGLATPRSATG